MSAIWRKVHDASGADLVINQEQIVAFNKGENGEAILMMADENHGLPDVQLEDLLSLWGIETGTKPGQKSRISG